MFAIQRNADAILFAVAGGISALLALFAWRRRALSRAPAFGAMMAGETAWALGEASSSLPSTSRSSSCS